MQHFCESARFNALIKLPCNYKENEVRVYCDKKWPLSYREHKTRHSSVFSFHLRNCYARIVMQDFLALSHGSGRGGQINRLVSKKHKKAGCLKFFGELVSYMNLQQHLLPSRIPRAVVIISWVRWAVSWPQSISKRFKRVKTHDSLLCGMISTLFCEDWKCRAHIK